MLMALVPFYLRAQTGLTDARQTNEQHPVEQYGMTIIYWSSFDIHT